MNIGDEINGHFEAAASRVRLQACAGQHLADARERANDERKAGLPAGSLHALMDSDLDELDPTDEEITAMGAECGLTLEAWADRLELFVAWARESLNRTEVAI